MVAAALGPYAWWVGLGGKPLATQCHHYRGRRGVLLLDKRFWIPVSASGHLWIENNRKIAQSLGLLARAGEWENPAASDVPALDLQSIISKVKRV